jgi:hypothetical protein
MVITDGTHQVQLLREIDAGYFNVMYFGDLDRKGPDTTASAVDQHFLSGFKRPFPEQALIGQRPRLWDRRGLFKRHALRLPCERSLWGAHILCKPAEADAPLAQISKHCIPRLESFHFVPDTYHSPRYVASDDLLRSEEAPDHAGDALVLNEPPIPIFDGTA